MFSPLYPYDKTLRESVEAWLAFMADNKAFSEHTITAYTIDIRHFFPFFSRHTGGEVTQATLEALKLRDFRSWLAARHAEDFTAASTARALSVVRGLYRAIWKSRQDWKMPPSSMSARRNCPKPCPKPCRKRRRWIRWIPSAANTKNRGYNCVMLRC